MVLCDLGGDEEYNMALKLLAEGIPYDKVDLSRISDTAQWERFAAGKLGCSGDSLIGAWQYLFRFGAIEESCVPYSGGYPKGVDMGSAPDDRPACGDVIGFSYDTCPTSGKPARRVRADSYYYVPGAFGKDRAHVLDPDLDEEPNTRHGDELVRQTTAYRNRFDTTGRGPHEDVGSEKNIRREIYHWGPVTTGFMVHSDFMAWDGLGVYEWNGKKDEGFEVSGHAVLIVGWGTEEGKKYWLIQNSWGAEWGDKGFFKIKRGTNECTIEENVFVGFPELPGFRLYTENPILYSQQDLVLRDVWNISPSGHKLTIIEKMLDGTLSPAAVDVDELIVDSDWWPALNSYVAAKPKKTKYPMRRNSLERLALPRNERERDRIVRGLLLLLGVAVGASAAYLILRNPRLRLPN
jgi:hypothetical protein